MDIQEMTAELQKFADANNLKVDVSNVLDNIDAGDYVELSQAMDNSDNRSIIKILQKYRARLSENFSLFDEFNHSINNNKSVDVYMNMNVNELRENYHSFVSGALFECEHLTLQEMRTLIYEDLTSELQASQIAKTNTQQNQTQQNVDPATQAKMKQAEIQKAGSNPDFKVSVPSSNGSDSLEQVVGIDIGASPEQSLVVTKDPNKANQVQVFGMNDVNTVNEEDECETGENVVVSEPQEQETAPEINVIDIDDTEDYDSPEDVDTDFVISQILDFCSKMKDLK